MTRRSRFVRKALSILLLTSLGCSRPYAVLVPRAQPVDEAFYFGLHTVAIQWESQCLVIPLSLGIDLSSSDLSNAVPTERDAEFIDGADRRRMEERLSEAPDAGSMPLSPGLQALDAGMSHAVDTNGATSTHDLLVEYELVPAKPASDGSALQQAFDYQLRTERPSDLGASCESLRRVPPVATRKALSLPVPSEGQRSVGQFDGKPEVESRPLPEEQRAAQRNLSALATLPVSISADDFRSGAKELNTYLIVRYRTATPHAGDILRLSVARRIRDGMPLGRTTFDLRILYKSNPILAALLGLSVVLGGTVVILRVTK